MRLIALGLIKHKKFDPFIIAVIILNTMVLITEASFDLSKSWQISLLIIDQICVGIFVIEAGIKVLALQSAYFKNGWHLFDFSVTLISVIPFLYFMSVLRALRIFRLISKVPSLRVVVSALVISIPAMLSTALLLLMVFVVFGIIGTDLFGPDFPQWFGHLGRSMYTLFQIMTLESWSMGIVRPIMNDYPWAWVYFIPFILFSSFVLLNFLIGIIVDAIAHIKNERSQVDQTQQMATLIDEIQTLQQQVAQLSKQKTDETTPSQHDSPRG